MYTLYTSSDTIIYYYLIQINNLFYLEDNKFLFAIHTIYSNIQYRGIILFFIFIRIQQLQFDQPNSDISDADIPQNNKN